MDELKDFFGKHDIDLFIIFWVGHGFIDEEWDRKLICADASPTAYQNIDFHDLRKALGQDGFPTRQIFLVDACASCSEPVAGREDHGLEVGAGPPQPLDPPVRPVLHIASREFTGARKG